MTGELQKLLPPGARELVPAAATPEQWARWHAFRRVRHVEANPDDTVPPDAVAEAELRHEDPFNEERRFVLERGGAVVSRVYLGASRPGTPEYEGNRHQVYFEIEVLPARRREGIATSWLPAIAAFARARGARLLTTDAHEPSGHAFLAAIGAEPRFRAWENRLWLDRVDWALMRRWAELDPAGTRLESYEPFPPEPIWSAYADGYTEMGRHVPREGLEIGDFIITPDRMRAHREQLLAQGKALHILAAWDADGVVGVTELLRSEHDPDALDQELTAVHPRARGRGLGKLLKARLLLELHERFPQVRFIRTFNAGSNAAMLAINHAMGFAPYREFVGYQLEVAKLP